MRTRHKDLAEGLLITSSNDERVVYPDVTEFGSACAG